MNHLFATEGTPSGTKTLLTVVVAAIIVRSFFTGLEVGGVKFGDASVAMTNLVDLAWVLSALYGGRRATDVWRTKSAPERPQ